MQFWGPSELGKKGVYKNLTAWLQLYLVDLSCIWLIWNEAQMHCNTTVGCYLELQPWGPSERWQYTETWQHPWAQWTREVLSARPELESGKMNYHLGSLEPIWAKWSKSGQDFLEVGKKKLFMGNEAWNPPTACLNFGIFNWPKNNQTPHRSFRDFVEEKTFTFCWSVSKVQAWVHIQALASLFAITLKGYSRRDSNCKINGQPFGAALRHSLGKLDRCTNTGCFLINRIQLLSCPWSVNILDWEIKGLGCSSKGQMKNCTV